MGIALTSSKMFSQLKIADTKVSILNFMADECAYIHKAFFELFFLDNSKNIVLILTLVSNFDQGWRKHGGYRGYSSDQESFLRTLDTRKFPSDYKLDTS